MLRDVLEFFKEQLVDLEKARVPVYTDKFGRSFNIDSVPPHINHPQPSLVKMSTLSSLVQYIKADYDELIANFGGQVFVANVGEVYLYSKTLAVHNDLERMMLVKCSTLERPALFELSSYTLTMALPALMTMYAQNDDRDALIEALSNVTDSSSINVSDNGFGAEITYKSGTTAQSVAVSNPVELRPYVTFPEIEPLPIPYVVRMGSNGKADGDIRVSTIAAGGDRWRVDYTEAIGAYLRNHLDGTGIEVYS